MNVPSSEEIIRHLGLQPLPDEGGWYVQSYVSGEILQKNRLPSRYGGDRPFATVIYYLLTADADSFSALHKLKTDEVWHFYLGSPAELLLLYPDGSGTTVILGDDVLGGQQLQQYVPKGVWQGCRTVGPNYSLMGTTMAPGFHPDDFTLADRQQLTAGYPEFSRQIASLTRA